VFTTKRTGSGSGVRTGGRDLVGQRRELVIHQDVAVLAITQPDIAAGAEQHGDAGCDLLHAYLDLREVLLGGCWRSEKGGGKQK
jgi:hypothetical protein